MRFVTFKFQGKNRLGGEQDGWFFHWCEALGRARVARHGAVKPMAALRDAHDWDKGLEDLRVPLPADLDSMRQQVEEKSSGVPGFQAAWLRGRLVQQYRQNGWEGSAPQDHLRHRG